MRYRFTVFTPTYNRGTLLPNLYHSLQRQTFRDFEWIIVDDGSTDNTEEVVRSMQEQENSFPILYQKTVNGGKHRAWNRGVELASGELFFGCDSDDFLTDDALETADQVEKSIPSDEKKHFAGVCGLKIYRDRQMVGETFSRLGYADLTHLERQNNNIFGDKSEVLYTAIWRRYKYHEFEGEKFLTEATALNRMAADKLKIRYFNIPIKVIEYRQGGLSSSSKYLFVKNPKGWGLYIYQRVRYGLLKGTGKWDVITDYYDRTRDRLQMREAAANLHMNFIPMACGITTTKLRYRLECLKRR